MWLSLLGPPAWGADPKAEAERLQEEVRVLARQGRWEGVELAWRQLLATGVPPTPEACLQAADAAQQLGRLIDVGGRLACATPTAENQARLQALLGSTTRVALFRRPSEPFAPEQMPFQPDAARAIRTASDALSDDGFWFGLLPVGRYRLGAATLALEPRTTLVAVGSGDQAQSDAAAVPHLGPFGGRWLDVTLTPKQVGAAVRSDREAADGWRTGGVLELAGGGGMALGVGLAVAGFYVPPPLRGCTIPIRPDLGPRTSEAGVGLAALGAVAVGVGTWERARAADRAEESFGR